MKICILTQPLSENYGGLLQAFALQKSLASMGHEVVTLRFKPLYAQHSSKAGLYWKTFRRFLSKLKGNKEILFCNPERQWQYYRRINEASEAFIRDHIHTLDAATPLKYKKLPPFDAYIVGSDQVWRPRFSPYLPDFYLGFVKDNRPLKIAYAASFGVDVWEASQKETERLRRLAQRFDRISVRESSGIALCRGHLGVETSLMPDPTMLLTPDQYLGLYPERPVTIPDQPYIATYLIDASERESILVNSYAEKHNLPVITLGDLNWKTGLRPMAHWIHGIANASCVITDSFHGTVFSLLFQKDFITFNNSWRGSPRFTTLLETFGQTDRLVQEENLDEIEIPPLDKDSIASIISQKRQEGLIFLSEALAIKRN